MLNLPAPQARLTFVVLFKPCVQLTTERGGRRGLSGRAGPRRTSKHFVNSRFVRYEFNVMNNSPSRDMICPRASWVMCRVLNERNSFERGVFPKRCSDLYSSLVSDVRENVGWLTCQTDERHGCDASKFARVYERVRTCCDCLTSRKSAEISGHPRRVCDDVIGRSSDFGHNKIRRSKTALPSRSGNIPCDTTRMTHCTGRKKKVRPNFVIYLLHSLVLFMHALVIAVQKT
jgi:hypothetical protein